MKNKKAFYIALGLIVVAGFGIVLSRPGGKSITQSLLATIGGNVYTQPRTSATPNFGYNGFFLENVVNSPTKDKDLIAIEEVLNATGAVWLRFPGGAKANDYSPFLNQPGYGQASSFDKNFSRNFIEDYADFAKQFKVKTTYVMNLHAHFPTTYGGTNLMPTPLRNLTDDQIIKMNLDAVEYLVNRGLEVPTIELGNETMSYELSQGLTGSIRKQSYATTSTKMKPAMDRYITLVNRYITELDALAVRKTAELKRPVSFKVGVPIASVYGSGNLYRGDFKERNKYWNDRVANKTTNKTDVKMSAGLDAFIPHEYADTASCRDTLTKKYTDATRFTCLKNAATKALAEAPAVIKFYKALVPGKEIWITEYNMALGFTADDQLATSTFVNSPEHVDFIKKINEIYRTNGVALYTLHMLFGTTSPAAIINRSPAVGSALTTSARYVDSGTTLFVKKPICALVPSTRSEYVEYGCAVTQ